MGSSVQAVAAGGIRKGCISVIVPVYNTAPYLRACLNSLAAQTYRDLEVICVDDGSTDESPAILKEYAAADPRFVVLHQANAGQAAARNAALQAAHGEFVTGVDSDDTIAPDCYEKVLLCMQDDVQVVCFGVQPVGEDAAYVAEAEAYFAPTLTGRVRLSADTIGVLTHNFSDKLFRREVVEQYGLRFPVGVWYEDMAFTQQYLAVSRQAYVLPDKLYTYYLRGNSTMGRTREKDLKSLDMLAVVSTIYDFYQRQGLWGAMRQQVHRLTDSVIHAVNGMPPQHAPAARRACAEWIRRWGLQREFLFDTGIQRRADLPLWRRVLFRFCSLFYISKCARTQISLLGVPVLTILRRKMVVQYKLFGVRVAKHAS